MSTPWEEGGRRERIYTFMIGAQKCTVFGPMGLFQNFAKAPCCTAPSEPAALLSYLRPAKRICRWKLERKVWPKRRPIREAMLGGGRSGGACLM